MLAELRCVDRALTVQFETVYFSDSDPLVGSSRYRQLPEQDADYLSSPFEYPHVGLESIRQNGSKEILNGAAGILVGTEDYQAPAGLGAVRSKYCYVAVGARIFEINERFPEFR